MSFVPSIQASNAATKSSSPILANPSSQNGEKFSAALEQARILDPSKASAHVQTIDWSRATQQQLQDQAASWTAQGIDQAEQARRAYSAGVPQSSLNYFLSQQGGNYGLAIQNAYQSPNNTQTSVQQIWTAKHSGAGTDNLSYHGGETWNDKSHQWDKNQLSATQQASYAALQGMSISDYISRGDQAYSGKVNDVLLGRA